MVEQHSYWYYHCLDCNRHFKLPKAVKFSLDKVKTPIYCPQCNSTHLEPSYKEFFNMGKVKKLDNVYHNQGRR